jgi:hypothetical protein
MRREFQNIDVECWAEVGKLGRALPAICLLHLSKDCGGEILTALNEIAAEAPRSKRTLTFKASTRKRPLCSLQLSLAPVSPDLRVLCIARQESAAVVEMTEAGIALVRHALDAWYAGAEDFCVASDQAGLNKRDLGPRDKSSGELWFWGPSMEP